jgi:hypothetical protein
MGIIEGIATAGEGRCALRLRVTPRFPLISWLSRAFVQPILLANAACEML